MHKTLPFLIVILLLFISCRNHQSGVFQYKTEYSYSGFIDTSMLFFNNNSLFISNHGFNNRYSFVIRDVYTNEIKSSCEYIYSDPTEVFNNGKELVTQFNLYETSIFISESISRNNWTITTDTLTICGFLCQKAKIRLHGRNYTSWFTKEIPVSFGPWKFNGLPGLILQVEEDSGYFKISLLSYTLGYNQQLPSIESDSIISIEQYLTWFKKEMPRILLPNHAVYDNPDLEVSVDISTFTELLE